MKKITAIIIAMGLSFTLFAQTITAVGSFNDFGVEDYSVDPLAAIAATGKKVKQVSLDWLHSSALTADGSLYMWGYGYYNGTLENSSVPIKVMDNVASVSLGVEHNAAITKDGSLYVWGLNDEGRLGNGTLEDSSFVPIKILDNVVSVSLGDEHSAAITEDGSLYVWGYHCCVFGNSTTKSSYVPIKIMSNVASVSLGWQHSAAITTDGSLYMWGRNWEGQIGNGDGGTGQFCYVPIKVMDDVASVSLGRDHSAAITKDGSLYIWGENYSGQLGNGDSGYPKYSDVPKKVMDNVASVSLGGQHSAAITTGGSLYMWGGNGHGQLGNGTTEDSYVPIKIMDNVASVSLGRLHSAAITMDGSLYMWGENGYSQLGNGTTDNSLVPIRIDFGDAIGTEDFFSTSVQVDFATNVNVKDKPIYAKVTAEWNEEWFTYDPTRYNHNLAMTSLTLASSAYIKGGVTNALDALKFEKFKSDHNFKNDGSKVSYTFGAKKISALLGNTYLIVISVRGTQDDEWYYDFEIGMGDTHQNFNDAKNDLMDNLKTFISKLNLTSNEKKDLKFLITGHSRGAAVANLTAAELNNDSSYSPSNIYAYTFATPNVSTKGTSVGYENIFNILNPEDFVTQVPLGENKWGYKHYGIDLSFPKKNSSDTYKNLKSSVETTFNQLTNQEYVSFGGTKAIEDVTENVFNLAPTVIEYYLTSGTYIAAHTFFMDVAGCVAKNGWKRTAFTVGLAEFLASKDYRPIAWFFINNSAVNTALTNRIEHAHACATYYSWLRSGIFDPEELFGNQYDFKRAIFSRYSGSGRHDGVKSYDAVSDDETEPCPVDIYVYDETGKLVASIVNDEIVVDDLAVYVEGGEKTVDLPNDQNYSIEVIARDVGTMTYTIDEYISDPTGNYSARTVSFYDVALEKNDAFSGRIDDITYTDKHNYSLIKNGNEAVDPDHDTLDDLASGDLNADGVVNITDAIELLKYVAKLENNVVNKAGTDIDGNGTVNINDAIALLKQIAGLA